jgi:hypothetical protein
MERVASGEWEAAGDIVQPSPVNCRTCHQIHTTFTDADYALTTTADVDLNVSGVTHDFGTGGNLCASCHQSRPLGAGQTPVLGGPNIILASSRYGYHHGPQADVMAGVGGVNFAASGAMPVEADTHFHGETTKGCPTCHMTDATYGGIGGGHTFGMTYEYHGDVLDNYLGCLTSGCHDDDVDDFEEEVDDAETGFNYRGNQEDFEEKMDELVGLLRQTGILPAAPSTSTSRKTGVAFDPIVVAAVLNWQMLDEDRSKSIHNPRWVEDMLDDTIDALTDFLAAPGN